MTGAAGDRPAGPPLILVTRPAEDAGPLMSTLSARGYAPRLAPLLSIAWMDGPPIVLDDVGALVFTSANGVRALVRRCHRRDRPVFAVGDATARTAVAAGFTEVTSAGGDIHALAALIRHRHPRQGPEQRPQDGVLLHVAGTDVAGDLAALLAADGFSVRREVLYQAVAAPTLPREAAAPLAKGAADGVVFFSPRTARSFVTLATIAGVSGGCSVATAYCLSAAVAEAAGTVPWAAVRVAEHPDQDSLLALLAPVER